MSDTKIGKAAVYGEPWTMKEAWSRPDDAPHFVINSGQAKHGTMWGQCIDPGDPERTIACVNACVGIEDPAAFRADVEALLLKVEAYRMASQLRIYELENGDDWTYEGDREQDLDAAEVQLCEAAARVKAAGEGA